MTVAFAHGYAASLAKAKEVTGRSAFSFDFQRCVAPNPATDKWASPIVRDEG